MSSPDPLQIEYQNLILLEKKRLRYLDCAIIVTLACIGLLIYSYYVPATEFLKRLILNAAIVPAILTLVSVLSNKGAKDTFPIEKRMFFVFYKTQIVLREYMELRNHPNGQKTKGSKKIRTIYSNMV